MSTLYIAELNAIGGSGNHPVSGAQWPPIVEQIISITGAAVGSAPVNANTTLLRLCADVTCSISIGLNAVATVATARMAANQTEYFSIPPNSGYRVSVISNT